MTIDLAAARSHLAANPGDTRHRSLLALLDPDWAPPAEKAGGKRPHTYDIGAVRRAQEQARAERRPPVRPGNALRFFSSAGWRWASVDSLRGGLSWARLVTGLVDAGPFQSLTLTPGRLADDTAGLSEFRVGEGGVHWVTVTVDVDRLPQGTLDRVVAHELAHVADYIASGDWPTVFADAHRIADAEAFAYDAEEWVSSKTLAADLIDAARRHQAGRHAR